MELPSEKSICCHDETRLEQLLSRLAQNKFSLAHTKVSAAWALSDESFRCIWSSYSWIWYVPLCLNHEKSRVRSAIMMHLELAVTHGFLVRASSGLCCMHAESCGSAMHRQPSSILLAIADRPLHHGSQAPSPWFSSSPVDLRSVVVAEGLRATASDCLRVVAPPRPDLRVAVAKVVRAGLLPLRRSSAVIAKGLRSSVLVFLPGRASACSGSRGPPR
uniref:Uncharacterized protein n=1 Tax=Zea mays TaxID=4577 RepID=A0A804NPP5_MAIZE